jgi:hypothetical protein
VQVIALSVPLLPAGGAQRRSHDINLLLLGAHQHLRHHIATVDEVRPGQQVARRQVLGMTGPITKSDVVADVVCDLSNHIGLPTSQVSLKCTL